LLFEDFTVELATNGADALQKLDQMNVLPNLIMLDMRMPVMNGWEFAHALSGRSNSIPILVMTAARDASLWAREIGAQGYIAKPFDLIDLLRVIDEIAV
jgi:CheY-like chemotaxis protein